LEAAASAVQLRDLCWVSVGGGPAGAPTGSSAAAAAARGRGKGGASAAAGTTAGAVPAVGSAGTGRLCASAAWSQAGTWAGEAKLTSLPLNLAKPFLPPDLTISGAIDGTAEAHGGSRGIAGANIDLAPGPGDLRFPAEQGRTVTVHFERGALRATAGPAGGNATAALTLQNVGTLNAQLRLPRLTQGISRSPAASPCICATCPSSKASSPSSGASPAPSTPTWAWAAPRARRA
jgi:autotransporter translocation and assembly factor TamB